MRSSEHVKSPMRGMSVWTTTAVMSSAVRSVEAFDPHVLEALGAVAGFEDVPVDAGADHHVGLERQVGLGLGSIGRRGALG